MNEKPTEEPGAKCVVLLGSLTQEGVTTKLRSLGYYYHNKMLRGSNPPNWQAAIDLISSRRAAGTLLGVFVDLTIGVFRLSRYEEYRDVWNALIHELQRVRATMYVYESALSGDFEDTTWFDAADVREVVRPGIQELQEAGLTVLPFQRHHEVTTSIVNILEELDGGVILRLYVPNKRYQSEQFSVFLRLLENYLTTVEKAQFTIDQRKTDHGLVYIFSSRRITSSNELDAAMARFRDFIELCEQDAAKAKSLLKAASFTSTDAESILARYSRDYRRLLLDTKHEHEHKLLLLRQALEAEVLDAGVPTVRDGALNSPGTSFFSLAGNAGPINISLGNNAVLAPTYEVGQIFNGDIIFSEDDCRIITLIDQYSQGFDSVTLKSALAELKDDSTAAEARKASGQKLKGFLYKAGSIVGEAAIKGLASYLEKLVTGQQ